MEGLVADLVCFRGTSLISRIICYFGGYWSHVGILSSDNTVLEASGAGVVETSLDYYRERNYIIELVPIQRDDVYRGHAIRSARSKLGRKYDHPLLIGNLLYRLLGRPEFLIRWTDQPEREICVEFVASSYRDAGEEFECDLNAMSPEQLAKHFGWSREGEA